MRTSDGKLKIIFHFIEQFNSNNFLFCLVILTFVFSLILRLFLCWWWRWRWSCSCDWYAWTVTSWNATSSLCSSLAWSHLITTTLSFTTTIRCRNVCTVRMTRWSTRWASNELACAAHNVSTRLAGFHVTSESSFASSKITSVDCALASARILFVEAKSTWWFAAGLASNC